MPGIPGDGPGAATKSALLGTISDAETAAIAGKREEILAMLRQHFPHEVKLLEAYDSILILHAPTLSLRNHIAQGGSPKASESAEDYSRFRAAADALAAYVEKHGPTPRLQVVDAVIAGGWAAKNPNARRLLREAINYQVNSATEPKISLGSDDKLRLPK